MKRTVPAALLIACLAMAPGCFVLDELDGAQAEMARYDKARAKGERRARASEAAPGADRSGGASPGALAARLQEWWQSARSITPGEDGSSEWVRCGLEGRESFMSPGECTRRGGRALD